MKPTIIISLAKETNRVITAVIRITAEALHRNDGIPVRTAHDVAGLSLSTFEELRPKIDPYFEIRNMRLHPRLELEPVMPWDVPIPNRDLKKAETIMKAADRLAENTPRSELIRRLGDHLGIAPVRAERTYEQMKAQHGLERFTNALIRVEKMTPKPVEPIAALYSVLRSPGHVRNDGSMTNTVKVKSYIRPANAETARTERLGWEAPGMLVNNEPRYRKEKRQLVYRNRSGHIEYVDAPPGEVIPDHTSDPGIQVIT